MSLKRMARRPWREVWTLGLCLMIILLWQTVIRGNKAILLIGLAVLGFAYHSWLRWSARRKLAQVSDAAFLEACRGSPAQEETAIRLRVSIARAFGIPADRVGADTRLHDLMALTGWFGSDLLAMSEVQEAADSLSKEHQEVKPELTVGDIVRHALSEVGIRVPVPGVGHGK